MKKCVICSSFIDDQASFCPMCGNPQPIQLATARGHFCDNCGAILADNSSFCPRCGKQIAFYKPTNSFAPNIPEEVKMVMGSLKAVSVLWYILAGLQLTIYGLALYGNLNAGQYENAFWCLFVVVFGISNVIYATRLVKYRGKIRTDYVGIVNEARYTKKVIFSYIYNGYVVFAAFTTQIPVYFLLFGGTVLAAVLVDAIAYRGGVKRNKEALLALERTQINAKYTM